MFARLRERGEGAFVPFAVIGDPTPERSPEVIEALIAGGADALELGIPFSDPIADGPTIQAASVRALEAGATPEGCLAVIAEIRQRHPGIPIGLLVYANLVVAAGEDAFYGRAAAAGVDSVLVADVPVFEGDPFVAAALAHEVDPVFIAPPGASRECLAAVAAASRGYTYVVARAGVTGVVEDLRDQGSIFADLADLGAPPGVIGFGISTPAHVRAAIDGGAAGAISGSAIVRVLEERLGRPAEVAGALERFVRELKAATR
jgi:tryptophan synthase alpha chain